MRGELFEGFGDFVPKMHDGPGCGFAQEGFEFREDLFDGVEIG